MDKLKDKLLKLKEELSKAMKQGGIGGQGSVKLGAILPSIKRVTSAGKAGGNNSTTPSTGITQPSKKNPIKQAEQVQNKDIKDVKMADAKSKIKSQPMVKFEANGQWSISKAKASDAHNAGKILGDGNRNRTWDAGKAAEAEADKMHEMSSKMPVSSFKPGDKGFPPREKDAINSANSKGIKVTPNKDIKKSGYKGYTAADNIKRKANNTSETTGIHSMDSIKQYGGSGPNAAAKEAAEMKRKSKKNPVKVYSKEEIAAINAEREK